MRIVVAGLAASLVLAVQLAACSRPVTKLDEDKTFAALTADERQQYCQDHHEYMTARVDEDDRHKIACSAAAGGLVGDGSARARGSCRQIYRTCLNTPVEEPQAACENFAADADGCAATVREANECAMAQADTLEDMAKKADSVCDEGSRKQRSRDESHASKLKACARVELLCPKLFTGPPFGAQPR